MLQSNPIRLPADDLQITSICVCKRIERFAIHAPPSAAGGRWSVSIVDEASMQAASRLGRVADAIK